MADVAAVEETVKRLASHKGVVGILIVNGDGVPIRTTLDQETAQQYAGLVSQLALKARQMVRELAADGTDDLQFLRVRSKKHEIMIAPGFDRVRSSGAAAVVGAAVVAVICAACLLRPLAHSRVCRLFPALMWLLPLCRRAPAGPQLHAAGGAGAAGRMSMQGC